MAALRETHTVDLRWLVQLRWGAIVEHEHRFAEHEHDGRRR
jgi:hypothetical protein